MKVWFNQHRYWVGFSIMPCGWGLVLEHYIRYGETLHYTFPDHGLVGLVLILAGALLGGKKA